MAKSILGWRGFKFVQMKGSCLFQGEIIRKLRKYIDKFEKSSSFSQTWHKSSLGQGYIRFIKWGAPPFSKGRWLRKSENTSTKILNLLLLNYWVSFIIYIQWSQLWFYPSERSVYSLILMWTLIQAKSLAIIAYMLILSEIVVN